MIYKEAADGPDQSGEATAGDANGAFVVTFSGAASAAAEAKTGLPKTAATASMRAPFRQPLVVDTDS